MNEVAIEQYEDGFGVFIDGEEFHFSQDRDVEGLVDVFQHLGFSASYEEVS